MPSEAASGMTQVSLPPPRALIFDWDNTLVDTWAVITTCYNATFAHFGMPPWTEAETRARAHQSALLLAASRSEATLQHLEVAEALEAVRARLGRAAETAHG